MKLEELFEQRSLVASKLKDCIRDKGYTKASFASKVDISKTILNKLLNGSIDNKSLFDDYLQKILKSLDMKADDLMFYRSVSAKINARTSYLQNPFTENEMNEITSKQYELLLDIIDLCDINY